MGAAPETAHTPERYVSKEQRIVAERSAARRPAVITGPPQIRKPDGLSSPVAQAISGSGHAAAVSPGPRERDRPKGRAGRMHRAADGAAPGGAATALPPGKRVL